VIQPASEDVISMMPYQTYQLFEAERTRAAAERRAAELQLSRAAAGASELRAGLAGLARAAARGLGRLGTRPRAAARRA
jgi:hypothetical protein